MPRTLRFEIFSVLVLFGSILSAQGYRDSPFIVGSSYQETDEVRTVEANVGWIIDDMDDGTNCILTNESYGLMIKMESGLVWIISFNLEDPSSELSMIGSLPIKLLGPSTTQFVCERGKFIHMRSRRK